MPRGFSMEGVVSIGKRRDRFARWWSLVSKVGFTLVEVVLVAGCGVVLPVHFWSYAWPRPSKMHIYSIANNNTSRSGDDGCISVVCLGFNLTLQYTSCIFMKCIYVKSHQVDPCLDVTGWGNTEAQADWNSFWASKHVQYVSIWAWKWTQNLTHDEQITSDGTACFTTLLM